MTAMLPPINFKQWIEDNREHLKPPVCNKLMYEDAEFIVMVVGGPNSRKDYHDDAGEELFYMVEGDMTLRIMEETGPRDIEIKEGEMFLLPPHVPHSPQRRANTVGLVIERKRRDGEQDGFMWFCDSCHTKLYEEYIDLGDINNIVIKLPQVFEHFWGNEANHTCKSCGQVMAKPAAAA